MLDHSKKIAPVYSSLSALKAIRRAILTLLLTSAVIGPSATHAEAIDVKYQGPVDISSFDCPAIKPSSFVNRICYQAQARYMVVLLRQTYYHYCDIGPNVVAAFIQADSLGSFYNANIKSSSNGGMFDCRGKSVPNFN